MRGAQPNREELLNEDGFEHDVMEQSRALLSHASPPKLSVVDSRLWTGAESRLRLTGHDEHRVAMLFPALEKNVAKRLPLKARQLRGDQGLGVFALVPAAVEIGGVVEGGGEVASGAPAQVVLGFA